MEHLHFSTHINAPRERIWNVLWNEDTYPQWTAPFGAGGRAESDWKEGGRIRFLSAEGDGMYAVIDRKDEPAFISFTHQGAFKDGKEQPLDDATRAWAGAKEQYTLKEQNGGTELSVAMDVVEGEASSFREMFPKAFAIVKQLAER
jgi:uncharacterized protein YndB with AHSA1/START domain